MSQNKLKSNRVWKIHDRQTVWRGFYQLDSISFTHELHSGGQSALLERELFVRGDVVGVLPYDRRTDSVALVEQFRIGALRQAPDPWMIEIIAGMIDTDEPPESVARREAMEEAGVQMDELRLIRHYLASPGASTEEVFLYFGETDLSDIGGLHGLAEEDEDIRVTVVPAEDAIKRMESGEIRNALSIIALQWLTAYRSAA